MTTRIARIVRQVNRTRATVDGLVPRPNGYLPRKNVRCQRMKRRWVLRDWTDSTATRSKNRIIHQKPPIESTKTAVDAATSRQGAVWRSMTTGPSVAPDRATNRRRRLRPSGPAACLRRLLRFGPRRPCAKPNRCTRGASSLLVQAQADTRESQRRGSFRTRHAAGGTRGRRRCAPRGFASCQRPIFANPVCHSRRTGVRGPESKVPSTLRHSRTAIRGGVKGPPERRLAR